MPKSLALSAESATDYAERARARLQGFSRGTYAVWEFTLKCNLACELCGSRAGSERRKELSTEEALEVARQLAEAGVKEVTLIGGEILLRNDWQQVVRALNDHGLLCSILTGGYGVSLTTARRMKAAGVAYAAISVDGMEATHDRLRGREGSWTSCFRTMEHFRSVDLPFCINSQLNRATGPDIPRLYEAIHAAGARGWMVQLTFPMGNAADHARELLQPCELLDLYPMLAVVFQRAHSEGVGMSAGDNVGYYGPYELLFRNSMPTEEPSLWQGCQAGLYTVGVESDGIIKACSSLPTGGFSAGNIRRQPLRKILAKKEMRFNLGGGTRAGVAHLWGFCKRCEYGALCRGGCSATAYVFFNRRGNNPYCHHRALEQQRRGVRERVVPARKATGRPYDFGLWQLVEEPIDAPWPSDDSHHFTWDRIEWPAGFEPWLASAPANEGAQDGREHVPPEGDE
ncbi:MAG: radical SAM protein [Myxococcales bacterium]|nr:radical SAM protein [Myxococcales bacterium]